MQKQAKLSEAFLKTLAKFGIKTTGTLAAIDYVWPLAAAAVLGPAAGYALNRLSRRADPTIADSNTKDDIKRVERLRKIQYYNDLAKQIEPTEEE